MNTQNKARLITRSRCNHWMRAWTITGYEYSARLHRRDITTSKGFICNLQYRVTAKSRMFKLSFHQSQAVVSSDLWSNNACRTQSKVPRKCINLKTELVKCMNVTLMPDYGTLHLTVLHPNWNNHIRKCIMLWHIALS